MSSEGIFRWWSRQARSSNLQAIVAQLTRHSRDDLDVDFQVVGCDSIQMDQDVWNKMEQHWPIWSLIYSNLPTPTWTIKPSFIVSQFPPVVQAVSWAIAWLWLSKWESGTRSSFWVLSPLWQSKSTAEDRRSRGVLKSSFHFMESSVVISTPFSMAIVNFLLAVTNFLMFSEEIFDRLMAVNPWVQTWWRAAESLGRLSQVLGRSCWCLWQTVTPTRFFVFFEHKWLAVFCMNPLLPSLLSTLSLFLPIISSFPRIVSSDPNHRLYWWVLENPIYDGRTSRIWGCSLGGGGWLRNGLA